MKKISLFFTCITSTLLAAGFGCSDSRVAADVWGYQPYIVPGEPAIAAATIRTASAPFLGVSGDIEWRSPLTQGAVVQGQHVVTRSLQFLSNHGLPTVPVDQSQREERSYDSNEIIWDGLTFPEIVRLAKNNPLSRDGNSYFDRGYVIVAVEPVILIIVPGLIEAGNFAAREGRIGAVGASIAYKTYEHSWRSGWNDGDLLVGLPGGLVYDTRVPRVSGLAWCSPDLGVAPTALQPHGDSLNPITVPWGELHFVRDGDIYRIVVVD